MDLDVEGVKGWTYYCYYNTLIALNCIIIGVGGNYVVP